MYMRAGKESRNHSSIELDEAVVNTREIEPPFSLPRKGRDEFNIKRPAALTSHNNECRWNSAHNESLGYVPL